ncbi:hypothetical protein ACROYT_G013290 [Oculina patagonica]
MRCFYAFLLCVSIANGLDLTAEEYERHWQAWKSFYGKTYESDVSDNLHFTVWKNNLELIRKHNSEGHTYTLTMNQFGDLTVDEYRSLILGRGSHFPEETKQGSSFLHRSVETLPPTVDWRTKGYVTPVKNQGQLGPSWAFGATGSLEGQHFKKTGNLTSLSERNLADCCKCNLNYANQMDCAFMCIKKEGGIDTEAGYPYPCHKSCCFDKAYVGATCTGYVDIEQGSESALQSAVAEVGPISVLIDAGQASFQFYHAGVYNEPSCTSSQLDHAVLVVGYGTYQGQDYWLVKNSWGSSWGMEGYIMMSRNKNNQCGIATSASYPLV